MVGSAAYDTSERSSDGEEENITEILNDESSVNSVFRIWLWNRTSLVKLFVIIMMLTVIIVAFTVFDVQDHLVALLEWIQDNQLEGAFLFIGIYCGCTVLFVPGAILTLGAGYIFRPLPFAILLVVVGASLGLMAAFLIGRFLFRDVVSEWAHKRPKFVVIDRAVSQEGAKIIFMLRLAPLLPFNAFNYVASCLNISFYAYSIASCTGIIPGTCLFCYIGSLAHDIQDLEEGNTGTSKTLTIVIAVVSGVIILGVVVFTTIIAKRALRRAFQEEQRLSTSGSFVSTDALITAKGASSPVAVNTSSTYFSAPSPDDSRVQLKQ